MMFLKSRYRRRYRISEGSSPMTVTPGALGKECAGRPRGCGIVDWDRGENHDR